VKLLDLVQGSEEWHNWRRPRIGASECAAIMGKDPYKTPYGAWLRKVHGEENWTNEDIERGKTLEIKARDWISKEIGIEFTPICGESEERPWQIASLDCYWSDGDSFISGEIKCPRLKKILEIQETEIPLYWLWQMQHQMSVSGAQRMFFLAYSEETKARPFVWVYRNEAMIRALNHTESIFYHDYMGKFTPPPFMVGELR
jgi:putative phage-type endonuclease